MYVTKGQRIAKFNQYCCKWPQKIKLSIQLCEKRFVLLFKQSGHLKTGSLWLVSIRIGIGLIELYYRYDFDMFDNMKMLNMVKRWPINQYRYYNRKVGEFRLYIQARKTPQERAWALGKVFKRNIIKFPRKLLKTVFEVAVV